MEETGSDAAIFDLGALTTNALFFHWLDVLPRHATFCAKSMDSNVLVHKIVTNRGKKRRTVYEPSRTLKWVQTRIREKMFLPVEHPEFVTGFVPGRGIAANAMAHTGSKMVVNIDLKNFFPSITPARVYGTLLAAFNLRPSPCSTVTSLVTHHGHLCQGFVTSPDIANLVSWKMDRRLSALAKSLGLRYTRYADDLTFSGREWHGSVGQFLATVGDVVGEEGFVVNEKKIAVMRRGRRQTVTGVVVSDDGVIGVDRKTRRLMRAACHHWQQQTPERKMQIRGWISYISSINPRHGAELEKMIDRAPGQWQSAVGQGSFSSDVERCVKKRRDVRNINIANEKEQ
jgi:RNA-directed DNA polymerase